MALPGRRDGRVVEDDRRLVDVGEHGGRARRRRAQDGHSAQEARQGLRAPQRPRVAVRLAAAREDHARGRDRAVDGLDIVAWDNAAMESLMGVIKAECVHARTFESRERAALEIFEYIECFYNRVRTHSALGYLSPEEFERANRPEDDRRLKAA